MTTQTIGLTMGTWVNQDSAQDDLNFSTRADMAMRTGGLGDCITYLNGVLPTPVLAGATVSDAKLVVYTKSMSTTDSHIMTIRMMAQGWSQSTMTWNNRPTILQSIDRSVTKNGALPDLTRWEFNVTADLQLIQSGAKWWGYRFKIDDSVARWIWGPKYATAAYRPTLTITYSDAPKKPAGLSPSGGLAVSTNKPVLKANFVDLSGSTVVGSVQVQLSTTADFTTPVFDTGIQTTTVPELDLASTFPRVATINTTNTSTTITAGVSTFASSDIGATITGTGIPGGATITAVASGTSATISAAATATGSPSATITRSYGGLADGATIFWRIQFWDGAGLASGWSDPASFSRDIKGGVTINSPSSGTPTVEDATPPILWSFTGETQAAYEIVISWVVNGVTKSWSSGWVVSTATTYTIPPGVITLQSQTYTVSVRIKDNKNRVATVGDPAYAEASRDFTFVPGATSGVSTLVVTTPNPEPMAVLTWTRATAPDWFNIKRNGKQFRSQVLPEEVFVSGTTYSFKDTYHPDPYRPITHEIQAVVNGVASATNNVVSTVLKSKGMWLRPYQTSEWLYMAGKEDHTWEISEQSVVLESLDGKKTLVTQSLGGFEGTIQGVLHDKHGKTAQEWRDIFIDFRKRGGRFWLTKGEYTMLGSFTECTYSQRNVPQPTFDVSFKFIQMDSLDSLELGYEN